MVGGLTVALIGLTLDGQGTERFEPARVPMTGPTHAYDGQAAKRPDIIKLITQQNPGCWNGVPGQTCTQETDR